VSATKHRILVVGQTPPPYGGQAIIIEKILGGQYADVELFHLRMRYSHTMGEVGSFQLRKVLHLVGLIFKTIACRLRWGTTILYYPPSGLAKVPMLRDIVYLICVRPWFERTIFHFHAGGLSELYDDLSPFLRRLFRAAYFHPDLAIRSSRLNPEDGAAIQSKHECVIPYGIRDHASEFRADARRREGPFRILYVGVLRESKGVLDLLEACAILAARGADFTLDLMGAFASTDFKGEMRTRLDNLGLTSRTRFLGVKHGAEKYAVYQESDALCFPTYFELETFGLVLLEAMQCGLPVVATRWRGVPSVVEDGVTGYLVPIRDPEALADGLLKLIGDPEGAARMGAHGRAHYLEHYTWERFERDMADAFRMAVRS
jgi:glycosyltransferase involved in cell wall biosynthesis